IFAERIVGTIVNRQIFKRAPRAYAAARIDRPVLAPIDAPPPLDARLPVRCADCHSGAPLENSVPLAQNPPPLGRCTHCHVTHVMVNEWRSLKVVCPSANPLPAQIISISVLATKIGPGAKAEVAFCSECHAKHRDFGPMVWSSSRLFPFDADGDGDAPGNPAADRRAGGIGTEALLAFDVPLPERPFSVDIPTITDPSRPGRVGSARVGMSWV